MRGDGLDRVRACLDDPDPPCWICGRKEKQHVDSDFDPEGCCTRRDLKLLQTFQKDQAVVWYRQKHGKVWKVPCRIVKIGDRRVQIRTILGSTTHWVSAASVR